jgi:Trypsin-like peptidase domain
MKNTGFAIIFWTCLATIGHQAVAAQNVPGEMRHRLVSIQVRDPSTQGNPNEGTGFLVSRDGFIVTSAHLFDGFPPGNLDSLKISISVAENDALHNKRAFVVESRPSVGVVLLKTPTADSDYPFVTLGTTRDLLLGASLTLSGFCCGEAAPRNPTTSLSSLDGSNGRTWVLSNQVDPGLIGGPVFRPEDGKVVGILDSVSVGGNSSQFVPIELANLVLVPLQLSDVFESLNQVLSPSTFNKRIGDETSNFLSQDAGKQLLTVWLKGYLAGAGDSDIEAYLKRNAAKFEDALYNRMKHLVNYSYNDTFALSTQGGPKTHTIPFYKADGDRGDLSCEATYPSNPNSKTYPNKILYTFNDNTTVQQFGISPTRPENRVKKFDMLASENASLYDQGHPTSTISPYQTIDFAIEDEPPINGPVTVQCTLLIIGTAKYD